MLCLECLGDGCRKCGDRGHISKKTKPLEDVTNAGFDLYHTYRWLKNYNILPVEGGLINQTAKFVQAVEFMDIVQMKYAAVTERFKTERAKQIESMAGKLQTKRRGRNARAQG